MKFLVLITLVVGLVYASRAQDAPYGSSNFTSSSDIESV